MLHKCEGNIYTYEDIKWEKIKKKTLEELSLIFDKIREIKKKKKKINGKITIDIEKLMR